MTSPDSTGYHAAISPTQFPNSASFSYTGNWSSQVNTLVSRVIFLLQCPQVFDLILMHLVLKCILILTPFTAPSKTLKTSKRIKPRVPPWNHLLLNGATSDPEEAPEIKKNVFIMKA